MSKSTKIVAGVVAGLGLAALPLGVFADVTEVEDTLSITVDPICSFTESGSTTDNSYSDTVANGQQTTFDDGNVTTFNVFCNNNAGWKVTASEAGSLTGSVTGNQHVISYTTSELPSTGDEGSWHAAVAGTGTTVTVLPAAGGIIAQQTAATANAGATFTITYSAYVGEKTAADTYTGSVTYTLAALPNSGS